MSWHLRLSVETILRLPPAVLGSTVFSIAELCAAHAASSLSSEEVIRNMVQSTSQNLPPPLTKIKETLVGD